MLVLFDQGTSVPIRTFLKEHAVQTASALGSCSSAAKSCSLPQPRLPEGLEFTQASPQRFLKFRNA
jgi:hypothetical protein